MFLAEILTVLWVMGLGEGILQRAPYQPPAPQPNPAAGASQTTKAAPPVPAMRIFVDQKCRLLPDPATVTPGKKPRLQRDATICHLENILDSEHGQEKVVGNELHREDIEVYEQEYVLQDVYPTQVLFVVEQAVAKGWTLDSDPPPVKVVGTTAFFEAWAQPGEVVHLHVGMRLGTPLKTVKLRPLTRAASTPNAPPAVSGH
jgi:hypothetical protein